MAAHNEKYPEQSRMIKLPLECAVISSLANVYLHTVHYFLLKPIALVMKINRANVKEREISHLPDSNKCICY